jgi:hypothetical protein
MEFDEIQAFVADSKELYAFIAALRELVEFESLD